MKREEATDTLINCDFCQLQQTVDKFTTCKLCNFDICKKCQIKSFTRQKIAEKTSRHSSYKSFYTEAEHKNDKSSN